MKKNLLLVAIYLLFICSSATAQGVGQCKPQIEYDNLNQLDPKPLHVRIVICKVVYQTGKRTETMLDVGPVPGACLGLFTEKNHQLIATSVANDKGYFRFSNIASGRYRLIIRDIENGLCVANVPLLVSRRRKAKMVDKPIIIHMRNAGIDDCSYGDYQSNNRGIRERYNQRGKEADARTQG